MRVGKTGLTSSSASEWTDFFSSEIMFVLIDAIVLRQPTRAHETGRRYVPASLHADRVSVRSAEPQMEGQIHQVLRHAVLVAHVQLSVRRRRHQPPVKKQRKRKTQRVSTSISYSNVAWVIFCKFDPSGGTEKGRLINRTLISLK